MRATLPGVADAGSQELTISTLARFLHDERGESAIEYALIAGMVACVIIAGLQKIGANMKGKFGALSNALT